MSTETRGSARPFVLPAVQELAESLGFSPSADDASDGWRCGFAEGIATGYAEGHEEGRRDGHRSGLAAGYAEATPAARQALEALEQAAIDLAGRDATTVDELADGIATMAVEIVTALLQREISSDREPAHEAIRRGLELLPERGEIVARLHPDDIAALHGSSNAIVPDRADHIDRSDDLIPGRLVTLLPDPTIAPGDAVLEVGSCRIDAQLTSAIERVREALKS